MYDAEFVLTLTRLVDAGGFVSFLTLYSKERATECVLHAGLNLFTGYGPGPKEALADLIRTARQQGVANHPKIAAALAPGQPLHGIWEARDK